MRKSNNLLRKNDDNLFRRYVIETLVDRYRITGFRAGNLVRKSSFNVMLKRDPEFVMHHSADYWAKKVIEESVRK